MDISERDARRRKEYIKRIQEFRLLDDEFMTVVFDGNIKGTQLMLNIILQRTDVIVTEVVGQREIKNIDGRSVRLDILAVDQTGRHYDIEVQRAGHGAVAQRARFNSSMLDTRLLQTGQNFSELVETYVIFITESDVLGAGKPLYHIDRRIEELDAPFGDGSHIIYVNGAYQDKSSAVGRLMHDFHCRDASDMYYAVLAERVQYFKQSKGGQKDMSQIMEELCNQAAAEATAEATHDKSVDVAFAMLKDGMDYQKVSKYSGLPIAEVEKLAELENVKN